ncbi:MAG: TRAM domain-containing protein [Beijerinckiaceae bacterium]|nr:TRAM domain-containing protein [Beijerinckiaceae bacterium]
MTGVMLEIERLGQRGEGVARTDRGLVFVPHALPGDIVRAEVDGERGRLLEVVKPSADRIASFCKYYETCGGCAVQALAAAPYAAWKRDIVVQALAHAKIETQIAPLVDVHELITRDSLGRPIVESGFMRARAHDIIDIDACPVLAPQMAGAPRAAHAIATALVGLNKPLDILITATDTGLDIDFRGTGEIDAPHRQKLLAEADRLDLARLSNHGTVLIERRAPQLAMGRALIAPPPGAFLQATRAGEEILARLAADACGDVRRALDLFAGVGTFALRLAEKAQVHAVEAEKGALTALSRAAGHASPALKPVSVEARDLYRRPMAPPELAPFDAVVFDPPRAGAEAQARDLAKSVVPVVVGVSCNPQTFARDARILIDGGYVLEGVTPVDQFRHSPHVELVATFRRPKAKGRRKGRLLG